MCGIIGVAGKSISSEEFSKHLGHLSRRGPDSQQAIQVSANCMMGASRLAMVDPHPRSNQPMVDKENGDVLTFNGEIYNYLQLRRELESLGVEFETESDTEVLLKFLQSSESPDLTRLNGMFAFAYFNKGRKTVSIGRDQLGKKPLFYSVDEKSITWGSSIWNVSALSDSSIRDGSMFGTYHYLGYELSPKTLYSKVLELNPGVLATFSLQDYSKIAEIKFKTSRKSKEMSIRKTLLEAVEKRIEGHPEVAISLSGGLDSTIIAILVRELGASCTTFSANWNDSDKSRYNSDGLLAKEISSKLGFRHEQVEMLATNELEGEINKFLIAMEEPNSNPTGVSMMKLYGAIANRGIRLTLTGDGADEIFSGYERYNLVAQRKNFLRLKNPQWDNFVLAKRNSIRRFPIGLMASQLSPNSVSSWLYWHSIFTPSEWNDIRVNKNDVGSEIAKLGTAIRQVSSIDGLSNPIEIMMKRDSDVWLSMESNKRLDRISMFHSIEARSPFQDDDLIQLANRKMLETGYKCLNKEILRSEFPEVEDLGVMKEKVGFISPVGHWMRSNPELVNSSLSYLISTGQFKIDMLKNLADEALNGNFRKISQIWNLIIYAQWIKLQALA
jgi:asparagine synthase (glutamine-hydrolysing)